MLTRIVRLLSYAMNRESSTRSPFYAQRLHVFDVFHRESAADQNVILFIGDSMIQSFEWAEYFKELKDTLVINRGINGDTVAGLAERIPETLLTFPNPQKIFIMVGANDLGMTRVFNFDRFMSRFG